MWRLENSTRDEQAETHKAIQQGLADIDSGRYRPVDVVRQKFALSTICRVALDEATADLTAGRFRPVADVFRDMRRKFNLTE
jgi:hypothetical protein